MLGLGGPGFELDRSLYLLLYGRDDAVLVAVARVATDLGGGPLLIPLSLAVAAFLFFRGRKADAALFLAITFGGRLLVILQKLVVDRPRPTLGEHLVAVESLSYPSGHAANGLIFWLTLALLLPRRRQPAFTTVALLLALAIGLSRVVLGVHWPSDVVGGWSFGLAWTLALLSLARPKPKEG